MEEKTDFSFTIDWDNPEVPDISDNDFKRQNVLDNLEEMRQSQTNAYGWRYYLRELEFDEDFIKSEYKKVREILRQKEIENCGKPGWSYHPGRGGGQIYFMCKHFDGCPKCQAWRKRQAKERLEKLKKKGKHVKAKDKKEHKEIVEKYGSDDIYCIPNEDGGTDIVVETDDDIGEPLNDELIDQLAEQAKQPVKGRKESGSAGKEPAWDDLANELPEDGESSRDPEEAKEKKVAVIGDPQAAISYCPIICDPDDPDVKWIIEWVERDYHPCTPTFESLEELQQTIYVLEGGIRQRAEDCGYSEKFHYLGKRYLTVKLSEVYWRIPEHLRESPNSS